MTAGFAFRSLFVALTFPSLAWAQANAGVEPAPQEKLNPLATAINVPATMSLGFNGDGNDPQPMLLEIQPRVPLRLTSEWRIVTHSDVSVVHLTGQRAEATGLSDLTVQAFVTPVEAQTWIWGVGPIIQMPAATSSIFGTGKWSVGPTAALVYVAGPWVNGIVFSHLRSVAGPSSRDEVSLTQVETQVSYTFSNNWYVQSAPTLSYNWRAPAGERWTVPIGVDLGRGLTIAAQEMSLQFGAYYSTPRASDAPRWSIQVQVAWTH